MRRCRSGSATTLPVPAICELEPDDAVLLYTDGVVEARAPDGELFELDRLADLLEREAEQDKHVRAVSAGWSPGTAAAGPASAMRRAYRAGQGLRQRAIRPGMLVVHIPVGGIR
jgi:Stage II sporulation protein E (SpoIIE)